MTKPYRNRIVPVGYLTNGQVVDDLNVVEMDVHDDRRDSNHLTPPKVEDESPSSSEAKINLNDSLDIYLAKPINESQFFTVESSKAKKTKCDLRYST